MRSRKRNTSGGSHDTIAAIITPPGEGGIAAIRIAGPRSGTIMAQRFVSHKEEKVSVVPFVMRYGKFLNRANEVIDEVTAVYMPHGKSYTGLEQVELFCHGGYQVVQLILDEILSDNIRAAEPGEFTRLAFENGRIDLARAEAVAEIIAANSNYSYQTARDHLLGNYSAHIESLREQLIEMIADVEASIDYPEEELDTEEQARLLSNLSKIRIGIKEMVDSYKGGKIVSEGFKVAIGGRPNAGKSSLFNLLLKKQRAIVTSQAGTTRDYLSELIDLGGFAVEITDTAGLRTGGGIVEKAGQKSAQKIIDQSNLVVWIFDLSKKNWEKELLQDIKKLGDKRIVLVANKCDLIDEPILKQIKSGSPVLTSCTGGQGISKLIKEIINRIKETMPDLTSGVVVTSSRHLQKFKKSVTALGRAQKLIKQNESPELVAFELRSAASEIDEITGKVYNEQILDKIFSKFCIGK